MVDSRALEVLNKRAQLIISKFDAVREKKKGLVEGYMNVFKGQVLSNLIAQEEIPLIDSMVANLEYFYRHRQGLARLFRGTAIRGPLLSILNSFDQIAYVLEGIMEQLTEELRLLKKFIENEDLFYYNQAFRPKVASDKCPYAQEQKLYRKLDQILGREREQITRAAVAFNAPNILRQKSIALVAAAALLIGIFGISFLKREKTPQKIQTKQQIQQRIELPPKKPIIQQPITSTQTPPSQQPIQTTQPITTFHLFSAPTITAEQIEFILEMNNSPAKGYGQYIYALGVKYGIDPAIPLAFFKVESDFGKEGAARHTKGLGNIRPSSSWKGAVYNAGKNGKFRKYNNWAEGFEDWYKLIRLEGPYARVGRTTLEQIIPVYAPESENNTRAYIDLVKRYILEFRSTQVVNIDGINYAQVKRGDSIWVFFKQYQKRGGKLRWEQYRAEFKRLNKIVTDDLREGKIYQLPQPQL